HPRQPRRQLLVGLRQRNNLLGLHGNEGSQLLTRHRFHRRHAAITSAPTDLDPHRHSDNAKPGRKKAQSIRQPECLRSSISSGFSLTSPRFFAAFTQFPNVPSLIPRSRAISDTDLPELINNSTASALNSGVNFLRVEPITDFPLVDNHSASMTVHESGPPPRITASAM